MLFRKIVQLGLPFVIGLFFLMVGVSESGRVAKEVLMTSGLPGFIKDTLAYYALPMGAFLFTYGVVLMSKVQSFRIDGEELLIGKGRFCKDEVKVGNTFLGITFLEVRGLRVAVFGSVNAGTLSSKKSLKIGA